MIGIYCLKIDKCIYIGSSTNIEKRILQHKHDLQKTNHCNRLLQQVVTNSKLENLVTEVLETYENITRQDLLNKEQAFIDTFRSSNEYLVFNIKDTNYSSFQKSKRYSREEVHNFRVGSVVNPFTGDIVNTDYEGNLIDAHSGLLI